MNSFVIYLSPVANSPRAPFIFPCYHCQVDQYKIPLKYRPLHTLAITPDSPLLQIHFKLEDLHFEYHATSSSSLWLHKGNSQGPANQSANSPKFFELLSQQWTTNLEVLRLFLAEPGSPAITIKNKRTLVADCLILDDDL